MRLTTKDRIQLDGWSKWEVFSDINVRYVQPLLYVPMFATMGFQTGAYILLGLSAIAWTCHIYLVGSFDKEKDSE